MNLQIETSVDQTVGFPVSWVVEVLGFHEVLPFRAVWCDTIDSSVALRSLVNRIKGTCACWCVIHWYAIPLLWNLTTMARDPKQSAQESPNNNLQIGKHGLSCLCNESQLILTHCMSLCICLKSMWLLQFYVIFHCIKAMARCVQLNVCSLLPCCWSKCLNLLLILV